MMKSGEQTVCRMSERVHGIYQNRLLQEVWAKSKSVGCGVAFVSAEREWKGRMYTFIYTYIVARYRPGGLSQGQFGANVFEPVEGSESL